MTDWGYFGVNIDNYDEYTDYLFALKSRRAYEDKITPDVFVDFVRNMAETMNASKVFVPAFGCGNLAYDLQMKGYKVYAYDICEEYKRVITKFGFELLDFLHDPNDILFDIICADLPFGLQDNKPIDDILEYASKSIDSNGICIFSFPESISYNKKQLDIIKRAENNGLFVNAFIDMPEGAYLPYTGVKSKILIFQKNLTEKRFLAGIEMESDINAIISNFVNFTNSKKLNLGQWIDPSEYSHFGELKNHYWIKKSEKRFGGESSELSEIIISANCPKDSVFEERNNIVFIPKIGTSDVVLCIDDFQIKPQNYIQVELLTESVLPEYVVFFYNTPFGKEIRKRYMNGVIPAFSITTIRRLPIIIPEMKKQKEMCETRQKISELEVQLYSLKNNFYMNPLSTTEIRRDLKNINHVESIEQWSESLPFPLASVLRRYLTEDTYEKRQEALFLFFEGYAAFHACVLLSILNSNKNSFNSKEILSGTEEKHFEHATFGTWVVVRKKISRYLCRYLGKNESERVFLHRCFKTEDDELINVLLSNEVHKILDKTNQRRNDWKGHAGVSSEEICREHVQELETYLLDLRKVSKDIYEKFELIRSRGMNYKDKIYDCKIEILEGSNALFQKGKYMSTSPLDENTLYIRMLDSDLLIELLPFIIFRKSPSNENNACYFYSKIDNGKTKYVSYHFENKPEDMENGTDVFEVIKSLIV